MACTDIPCLVVFFACLAGLAVVTIYAKDNGDFANISRGYNTKKELCGVGDLKSKPYMLYCLDGLDAEIDLNENRICTDACPTSSDESECQDPYVGYASRPVGGRTCMPTSETLVDSIMSRVNEGGQYTDVLLKITTLPEAWLALLCSGVIAFLIGLIFLNILELFAKPLMYVCFLVIISIPTLLGAFLVYVSTLDPAKVTSVAETGLSQEQDRQVGCVLLGIGAIMFLCMCCSGRSINLAVDCVEMACDAIFSQTTLLAAPFVEVASKIVLSIPLVVGFFLLLSVGEVKFPEGDTGYGVFRTFEYKPEQWGMIVFYFWMILWLMELSTSISQYAIAYAVQKWYFTAHDVNTKQKKNVPHCAIIQGYVMGCTVHLGTMAFGSCLIATLKLVRYVLSFIADKEKATGNPITACLASVCVCVVDCFERTLKFLNKTAYIEVAIKGTGFCPSAHEAVKVMATEITACAALNGATTILQFVGVGAIACGGAISTWFLVTLVPTFADLSSEHHVENPLVVTGAAAVISGVVGMAFMAVFDVAADTMLFCYADETTRGGGAAKEGGKDKGKAGEQGHLLSFLSCARPKPAPPPDKPIYSTEKLRGLIAQNRK